MKYKVKKIYKKICLFAMIPTVLIQNPFGKNEVEAYEVRTVYEWVDSIEELKQFFPGQVTFHTIRTSLKSNANINDEYRAYTNEFIDLLEEKYPDIDLTVFNENLKIFEVKEITKKDMMKNKNRESYYHIPTATIYMHDEYKTIENKKYCYFHELWHMFNNLYIKDHNNVYYKSPSMYESKGTAFDEGMTTFLTEQLFTSDIQGYTKQYDEISILYDIYGDDFIKSYLDSEIEGVELFLSNSVGYENACQFIQLMNDEWKKQLNSPLDIYEILSNMYHNQEETANFSDLSQTIDNLCYDKSIKKEIKSLFGNPIIFDENWKVTVNGENYYTIDDLYFLKCEGSYYLVNDEIVKKYFQTGYIQNVDDEDFVYARGNKLCDKTELSEYTDVDIFHYDMDQNIVFVDIEKLKGGSYVKSK